ncbi:MAG: TlpA disulfide reductase family protein [Bryobacter sp.]|nr:TlpA disulfide reductase family protein [Bryobacter sp.]
MMQTRRGFAALLGAASLAKGATVPRPAPEYGFEVTGGKQVLLSQYRGKVVMVCFFLTTCPHCKDTARTVEKLYKELGPQGFQPLGVCINDMAKLLTADFNKEQGVTFPCGYAPREGAYNFLQHPIMHQLYMPALVMVDRKGTIIGQYPGGDPIFGANLPQRETNLRKLVTDALASGASPTRKTTKKKAS